MLPSEILIWQPEFTDKTLSRKPGAVHPLNTDDTSLAGIIGLRLGNESMVTPVFATPILTISGLA